MSSALVSLLRCPVCLGKLILQAFEWARDRIDQGILKCACGRLYPVIEGIPRFVSGVTTRHPVWMSRYGASFPQSAHIGLEDEAVQNSSSVLSFGFEWKNWEIPYNVVTVRRLVLEQTQLTESFFPGKLILDAGCGAGLQARFMANLGAEVIAVDLSDAVEVAASNVRAFDRAHVVQADLALLPFALGTFDLVYSEGVIHHTADPKRTFKTLVAAVKPGGYIAAGLYHRPSRFSLVALVKEQKVSRDPKVPIIDYHWV